MTNKLDVKSDFAIYDENPTFAYFDSASTTLVPKAAVLETSRFLNQTIASARRGAHSLVVEGATIVEKTRTILGEFLETEASELSFQKSISSAVGSLVYGYDWQASQKNKIVVAQSEENSVLVQILRAGKILGLEISTIPIDDNGNLNIESSERIIDKRTGIVAVGHVTVGTGTTNPLSQIARITHDNDAILLTDASRSIGFRDERITELGADVVIFSANIGLMAPPGLALQWIDQSVGNDHIPGILGGSAVANVEDSSFHLAFQPDKFESGIINVPAISGLKAALQYLTELKSRGMYNHLEQISHHMISKLSSIDGIELYGTINNNRTIFGFNIRRDEGISCHDVALFLDESGIAVKSGLLCAHPFIRQISDEGIVQASIHAYNSLDDVNLLSETLTTICNELV